MKNREDLVAKVGTVPTSYLGDNYFKFVQLCRDPLIQVVQQSLQPQQLNKFLLYFAKIGSTDLVRLLLDCMFLRVNNSARYALYFDPATPLSVRFELTTLKLLVTSAVAKNMRAPAKRWRCIVQ